MDKNTLIGILLMALVFFGFMWLGPKEEDKKKDDKEAGTVEAVQQKSEPKTVSFSDQEASWLADNVNTYGTQEVVGGKIVKRYSDDNVDLTVADGVLSGTVRADGHTLTVAELKNPAIANVDPKYVQAALNTLNTLSNDMVSYGEFLQFKSPRPRQEYKLENDVLALRICNQSGTITRAELKKYDTEYTPEGKRGEKRNVVMFEGLSNLFNFNLPNRGSTATDKLFFTPRQVNDSTIRMLLEFAPETYWGFEYVLPQGDSYLVKANVVQKNMDKVVRGNNHTLALNWEQWMKRQENGRVFEERQSGLYYKFAGGDVEHLSENKNQLEERRQKLSWIGFKNQFFSTIVVPSIPFSDAKMQSSVIQNNDYLKYLNAQASVPDYDWTTENPVSFTIFIGPNSYPLMSHIEDEIVPDDDLNFVRVIPLGWTLFRWINTGIIIPVFNFLGKFISNYGIIILLLTIFIKLLLFPLTYKSYVSQAKMKILQPDIKALREKYPGQENALILNQKMMELYRRAGASPLSGCLPMLLQIPILFAVFQFFPSCIELRGQSFLWAHDLAAPDAIISWSGNIPLVTEYFGNHVSLFCLLMTGTNILYTYINTQNSPQTMPGMKWMMYLMPIFFLVFFNNYAAGLSYYYFLSLLITIIQTYAIRYFVKEEDVRKAMEESAKKPRKKSGFMARLEEMQKRQQQMLKEQQQQRNKGRR